MLDEIAAVDPDTAMAMPAAARLRRQRHHSSRGALGVIGVDQQDEASRTRMRAKCSKASDLVVMSLDEGMRHRAETGNAEFAPGRTVAVPAEPAT